MMVKAVKKKNFFSHLKSSFSFFTSGHSRQNNSSLEVLYSRVFITKKDAVDRLQST